jgi:hypothetical protein
VTAAYHVKLAIDTLPVPAALLQVVAQQVESLKTSPSSASQATTASVTDNLFSSLAASCPRIYNFTFPLLHLHLHIATYFTTVAPSCPSC